MSTSGSSLITIASFSGLSKFSDDLNSVLTRAVSIQSLNLESLQQAQTQETSRQTALASLDTTFSNLQKAIDNLTTAMGTASLTATVSDSSVASISVADGAQPADFSLEVQDLGSYSQSISSPTDSTVTDITSQNLSSSSSYTLTVNGVAHTLSLSTNSMQALANAINSDSSLGVKASIINTGSNGSYSYRLSLQARDLGATTMQLSDGTNDLMTTLSTGSTAKYKLNGTSEVIESNSRKVTLSPGVTATLTGTNSGSPATIALSRNSTTLQNAVQTFVTYYNGVAAQLAASHGSNGNGLQGDSILTSAQSALRQITSFTDANSRALSSLGITLEKTGQMTFDASTFSSLASENLSAITQFLGDSTQGFIKAATDAVQSMEDASTGLIKLEAGQITKTLANMSTKIDKEVDRINIFQQNLLERLSTADATIYQLENQTTFFTGLFKTNSSDSDS